MAGKESRGIFSIDLFRRMREGIFQEKSKENTEYKEWENFAERARKKKT